MRLPTSAGSRVGIASVAALFLYGCASTHTPAPVTDRTASAVRPSPKAAAAAATDADTRPDLYTVKRGDTLYLIALDLGLDYKDLAAWNNIANPNVIYVGQQLRVRAPPSGVVATPLRTAPGVESKPIPAAAAPAGVALAEGNVKSNPKAVKVPYSDQALAQLSGQTAVKPLAQSVSVKPDPRPDEKPALAGDDEKIDWSWPVDGKLASAFQENTNLKGISIAGKLGQAVTASAPGRVLYSGDGIRGYGKLVIIKHNSTYLSVYAHNSQLVVKEGQNVLKGQKIAEMGSTDAESVKLHFEIRRFGKPVDPIKLLPPTTG